MDESPKEPKEKTFQEHVLTYLQTHTELELMKNTGASRKAVDSWKTGKVKVPKLKMQERIFKVLGKSREELGFTRKPEKENTRTPQAPVPSPVAETQLPDKIVEQRLEAQTQVPPGQQKTPELSEEEPEQKPLQEPDLVRRRIIQVGIGMAVAAGVAAFSYGAYQYNEYQRRLFSLTPTATRLTTSTPLPPVGNLLYTYHGHFSFMTTARWSPNSIYIASGSADQTVQVWNANIGNNIYTYRGHAGIVLAAEWSSNGTRIASSASDETVQVWDFMTGDHVLTYRGHKGTVYDVAWSPGSKYIVSAGADDHTAQIWDAIRGTHILTYLGHSSSVLDVA